MFSSMPALRVGLIFAVAASLMLSTRAVLMKQALLWGAEPGALVQWRMLLGAPIFAVLMMLRHGAAGFRLPGHEREVAWVGILGLAGATWTSVHAIDRLGASLATVITFIYPALTVIWLAFRERRLLEGRVAAAVAISFAGVLLATGPRLGDGGLDPLGVAGALACAVFFSVYNVRSEPIVRRHGALRVSGMAVIWSAAAISLAEGVPAAPADARLWVIYGLLATVTGVMPFLLVQSALRRIGAARVVILNMLAPPLTVTWAALWLGERPGPAVVAGLSATLVGAALAAWAKRGQPTAIEAVDQMVEDLGNQSPRPAV